MTTLLVSNLAVGNTFNYGLSAKNGGITRKHKCPLCKKGYETGRDVV
jgi:hypothetical protein